ncbi:MAG: transposase [Planctomycetes bacterium]|nr:transposase [Planctomycetota bacterium]
MKIADIITEFREPFEEKYRARILPGHHKALTAMVNCQTPACGEMMVECPECKTREYRPHSCGHRNCPQCQNHDATQWLEKQRSKLLPVRYFLVTLTVPEQLRNVIWYNQRSAFDAMFQSAIEAIRELAADHRYLGGEIGATGILHTHSRRLDFHPHLHFIVPAGAIDRKNKLWKRKRWKFLFPQKALAKLFKGKLIDRLEEMKLVVPSVARKIAWVADSHAAGRGEKALEYLSRYLYRGVLSEKNIIANKNGNVTFSYVESKSNTRKTRTLPGEDFLWLLIQHVLPKGFRRARDYGFLHGNAKKTLQLLQLILQVKLKITEEQPRPSFPCPKCGNAMVVLACGLQPKSNPVNKASPVTV